MEKILKIALNSSQVLTLSLENIQIEKASPLKDEAFYFFASETSSEFKEQNSPNSQMIKNIILLENLHSWTFALSIRTVPFKAQDF